MAVLTAVVGTTVFATLSEDASTAAKVAVGLVTIAAAIFSGVQAFAGLPQRLQHYRDAARRYGVVRRDIEQARLMLSLDCRETEAELTRLRLALDAAADGSPNAPRSVWERTRRHIKGEFTRWERRWAKLKGLPPPKKLGLRSSVETNRDDSELAPGST